MNVITSLGVPASPARVDEPTRAPLRVGAVQERWHADADEHRDALAVGVAAAVAEGARLVCLMELTLSRYFAVSAGGPSSVDAAPEVLTEGPTFAFAAEQAMRHRVFVHASLWEADATIAPRGWNTAICVAPDGTLAARTRKVHIPVTAGYHEDRYFAPGDSGFPVYELAGAKVGLPTCWDQWFPELARAYSLRGAEVLVYPTAIGSEPDHPRFDTQPLWRQVMLGNAIANGVFMVAVNRVGTEPVGGTERITFYGSSFIADPYGRVLVEAPRDAPAVLVADLDLAQRHDWLTLFPFLTTRRPEVYDQLVRPNPETRGE